MLTPFIYDLRHACDAGRKVLSTASYQTAHMLVENAAAAAAAAMWFSSDCMPQAKPTPQLTMQAASLPHKSLSSDGRGWREGTSCAGPIQSMLCIKASRPDDKSFVPPSRAAAGGRAPAVQDPKHALHQGSKA
eukprot:1146033-Pelagomonas_calceolata.AAC.4